jgi:hypothetical protein
VLVEACEGTRIDPEMPEGFSLKAGSVMDERVLSEC